MILKLLIIQTIIVIGIDVLGFWNEISKIISGIITKGKVKQSFELKPFSCSTCSGFWLNILYLFLTHNLSIINIGIAIGFAVLAPEIGYFIRLLKDWLTFIIIKITPKNEN